MIQVMVLEVCILLICYDLNLLGVVKKLFVCIFIISSCIFIMDNDARGFSSGAPDACTGSPADGQTCASCHAGAAATVLPNIISTTIPSTGYIPGNTYTVTAFFSRVGHSTFGFQISPQDNSGIVIGSLNDINLETQVTGFGTYTTHSTLGTSGVDSKTWTFEWTAPSAGVGSTTFYGAFNAANGNGSNNGDSIFTTTHTVYESTLSANQLSNNPNHLRIFPNPVKDHFTIRFNELEGEMNLVLFTLEGKKIFEKNDISILSGDVSTTVNLEDNIIPGNYFLDITVGEKQFVKKIIIQ